VSTPGQTPAARLTKQHDGIRQIAYLSTSLAVLLVIHARYRDAAEHRVRFIFMAMTSTAP
jgi:hypothetical protein